MTLSAANEKDTVVSGWDGGGINSSCACTPAATKVVATNKGLIIGKAFIAMPLRSFTKGTIIPLILLSITCAFPSVGRNPYLHPRFNAYPMTEYNAFGGGLQQPGENHPITSLILLLALVFAGAIVFCVLSVFIGLMVTNGSAGIGNLGGFLSGNTANATFLKIVQGGSSIGMFVFPSLLMGIIEKRQRPYLDFKAPVNPQLWFILLGIMFFSAPIFEQTIKLNERLVLPESLSGMESWMKAKEAELEQLTRIFLSDTTYWGLFVNLLVVAVIAAIGEEFLFRGCVQGVLMRWFRNPHAAIWVTAIVFSTIHLQFYGFLPRMLLGALFGYLLLWGKNIWLPVFAHFVNNATAVVSAFYLQRQGRSLDDMAFSEQIPSYLYFISFVLTGVLLYQYHKTATEKNTRRHGKTLG